jgi:hypothetical protein
VLVSGMNAQAAASGSASPASPSEAATRKQVRFSGADDKLQSDVGPEEAAAAAAGANSPAASSSTAAFAPSSSAQAAALPEAAPAAQPQQGLHSHRLHFEDLRQSFSSEQEQDAAATEPSMHAVQARQAALAAPGPPGPPARPLSAAKQKPGGSRLLQQVLESTAGSPAGHSSRTRSGLAPGLQQGRDVQLLLAAYKSFKKAGLGLGLADGGQQQQQQQQHVVSAHAEDWDAAGSPVQSESSTASPAASSAASRPASDWQHLEPSSGMAPPGASTSHPAAPRSPGAAVKASTEQLIQQLGIYRQVTGRPGSAGRQRSSSPSPSPSPSTGSPLSTRSTSQGQQHTTSPAALGGGGAAPQSAAGGVLASPPLRSLQSVSMERSAPQHVGGSILDRLSSLSSPSLLAAPRSPPHSSSSGSREGPLASYMGGAGGMAAAAKVADAAEGQAGSRLLRLAKGSPAGRISNELARSSLRELLRHSGPGSPR